MGKDCVKCDEFQRDRQGRECRYCSWRNVTAPQPPADAATESRSVQRRKAAQKSEPAPTFAAGPPVTGDGDAARDYDGSLADSYNWADRTPQECLAAARAIERDAHAAGLARGRALGAREEREALVGIISDRMKRCGHRTGTCRSCMEDGAMIEIIEARRAGRGT